jgi:molybdopterin synthase catalytic subunit
MVEVRREDFSVAEIVAKMRNPKIGAVVIYLGVVREFPQGSGLEFEDKKEIIQKLQRVEDRAIIHRVGSLSISDNILLIAVSAPHRQAAFDACKHIVDKVKDLHRAWSKEIYK